MARPGVRAWLGGIVAAIALTAIALVALHQPATTRSGQVGPGQPLGAVSPVSPTPDETRGKAVTALLDRRAAAIRDRDEAAFTATLDPKADQAFLAAQRDVYTNLAGVPLDSWSYLVHADDVLDLDTLREPAADPTASELWAPAVDLSYALRGADLAPTTRAMGYLFAKRDGQWYLRSDTALGDLGRKTWRGPWDFGPCQVTATADGIVLAHPGNQPMVDRLVHELDPSVRAVASVWGADWPQRVALVLPDNAQEMRALVGPDFPIDSVVAVSVADRVDSRAHTATGQRVVLSPSGARALSLASLRVVLRHEITHVASRADTVDGSPMWLLEGFADYVGYRDSGIGLPIGAPDLAAQVRASGAPRSLPADQAFRGSGKDLDLAYQQSWSITRFVAEHWGESKLVELYHTLAGAGPASAGDTDTMLRTVLGLDRAGLLAQWQGYLRANLT